MEADTSLPVFDLSEVPSSSISPSQQQPRYSHPDTRTALLRQLQKEKSLRHLKLRKLEEKRIQRLTSEDQMNLETAELQRKLHKDAILAKLAKEREELQKRQIERIDVKKRTDGELLEVKKRTYLHQRLDEETKTWEIDEIREREKALETRRKRMFDVASTGDVTLRRHRRELDTVSLEREERRREKTKSQEKLFRMWREELRWLMPEKVQQQWVTEVKDRQSEALQRAKSLQALYDKKRRYAGLVRELFPPRPREKSLPITQSSKRKVKIPYPLLRKPQKRWTPQPSRRSVARTPPPERRDYLTPLRLHREQSFLSHPRAICKIQLAGLHSNSPIRERVRQIQKVDAAARTQETLLRRMERDWSLVTEGRQAAADLYLTAIRAKLGLLAQL